MTDKFVEYILQNREIYTREAIIEKLKERGYESIDICAAWRTVEYAARYRIERIADNIRQKVLNRQHTRLEKKVTVRVIFTPHGKLLMPSVSSAKGTRILCS
jgi:hypothetical protein